MILSMLSWSSSLAKAKFRPQDKNQRWYLKTSQSWNHQKAYYFVAGSTQCQVSKTSVLISREQANVWVKRASGKEQRRHLTSGDEAPHFRHATSLLDFALTATPRALVLHLEPSHRLALWWKSSKTSSWRNQVANASYVRHVEHHVVRSG